MMEDKLNGPTLVGVDPVLAPPALESRFPVASAIPAQAFFLPRARRSQPRGCAACLISWSTCNEVTAIVFLLLSFLFCLANGRSMVGYTVFLSSQILGSAAHYYLSLYEYKEDHFTVRTVATCLQLGLTCAFAAFQFALVHDYEEKCNQFKSIEDRTFNFAFAYNCDGVYLALAQIFVLLPITVCRGLGSLIEFPKCCYSKKNTRRDTPAAVAIIDNNEDPQNSEPLRFSGSAAAAKCSVQPAFLGCATFAIVLAATVPSFYINNYAEIEASCPAGNVTSPSLFRAKPAKGVELKECGWRRWEGHGTCVKYPFNPTNFGATTMESVRVGKWTQYSYNYTDPCDVMLGLFSCAIHSGRSGDFITHVEGLNVEMNVCPDWCDRVFEACGGMDKRPLGRHFDTAEKFCKNLGSANRAVDVTEDVSKPNNGCYNKGFNKVPSSMALWLSLLVVTLTLGF